MLFDDLFDDFFNFNDFGDFDSNFNNFFNNLLDNNWISSSFDWYNLFLDNLDLFNSILNNYLVLTVDLRFSDFNNFLNDFFDGSYLSFFYCDLDNLFNDLRYLHNFFLNFHN